MALAIIAMFGSGLWIEELNYYDKLYQTIPHIHESIGIILVGVLVFRLIWRMTNVEPDTSDLKAWERLAAHGVHWGVYALIAAILISGYLISTADGRLIAVFNWFDVPAIWQAKHQEDIAGDVHEILANGVIALAVLHTLAALKHHYIDGGGSLRRMLPPPRKSQHNPQIDPQENSKEET